MAVRILLNIYVKKNIYIFQLQVVELNEMNILCLA